MCIVEATPVTVVLLPFRAGSLNENSGERLHGRFVIQLHSWSQTKSGNEARVGQHTHVVLYNVTYVCVFVSPEMILHRKQLYIPAQEKD